MKCHFNPKFYFFGTEMVIRSEVFSQFFNVFFLEICENDSDRIVISVQKKKKNETDMASRSYNFCKKPKQSNWFDKIYFLFMVSKKNSP